MLTNAEDWRPAVARCALVHLGFRSAVGNVTHDGMNVRFVPDADLEKDVDAVCRQFKITNTNGDVAGFVRSALFGTSNGAMTQALVPFGWAPT
jgi:hypothetical protein